MPVPRFSAIPLPRAILHLHFAIWEVAPEILRYGQGEPVNPYPLFKGA
jgi:hypothetical protein